MALASAPSAPGFTGNHSGLENPAFFVAAGPGIAVRPPAVPITELTRADLPRLGGIIDFAPTLLALANVPFGEDMTGRPLATVLDPGFLAAFPPRTRAKACPAVAPE